MFDYRHYVPVLKAKAGELRALDAANDQGVRFTPLLELCRADISPKAAVDGLKKAWHVGQPVFVDAMYIEQTGGIGDNAIELVATEADKVDLAIIPVTGLDRTPAQRSHAAAAAAQHGNGACVRLTEDDIEEPTDIDSLCKPIVSDIGLPAPQIHVIIDMGPIVANVSLLRRGIADAIAASTFLQNAKTLTVAGSAFPQTLSGIEPGVFTSVSRSEWTLWNALCFGPHGLRRLPTFGDYAAAHPLPVEFDAEKMTPAAKIVYTTNLDWLILKGKSVRGRAGYAQYRELSRQMVARPEYRGANFSLGDEIIHYTTFDDSTTGNLTTWVTVKTSHHLAHVADQLASLP